MRSKCKSFLSLVSIALLLLLGATLRPAAAALPEDLGTLGGTSCEVYGINASGQTTGNADLTGDIANHAFLWTPAPLKTIR